MGGEELEVVITEPGGEQRRFACEDVYLINEKSYGYPEKLLDEEGKLTSTVFINTGAVLAVEIK